MNLSYGIALLDLKIEPENDSSCIEYTVLAESRNFKNI